MLLARWVELLTPDLDGRVSLLRSAGLRLQRPRTASFTFELNFSDPQLGQRLISILNERFINLAQLYLAAGDSDT